MKLFIDTSNRENTVVEIDGERTESGEGNKSQRLLSLIKEAMDKKQIEFSDLSEIEVNTGPGSFTGLKVGVAVAQTLGWALGIPVNGKDLRKGGSIDINY